MKPGLWGLSALLSYLVLLGLNLALGEYLPSAWPRMVEYMLLSVALLGFLARWRAEAGPYVWRPVLLLLGAALAAAEVAAWSRKLGLGFVIDEWMAALIGVAIVSILARLLPASLRLAWLGQSVTGREPAGGKS